MPIISVIIPVFNEENNITLLYKRLNEIALESTYKFEFIFVDDCSIDSSFQILNGLALKDKRLKVIRFSRNFGSHAAFLAGLINSIGDACVLISCDMQEPPELLIQLIKEWEKGNEIVFGVRGNADGTVNFFSRLYYRLVRKFALKNMPEMGTDVVLIERKVVAVITSVKENNTSIFALLLWSGFRQAFVPYKRKQREIGTSKWTLVKKIKLFVDTFVSFSYFPIRLMSVTGIVFSFLGFLYATIVIFRRIFFEKIIEGWTSLMVVLLVVSGIQMLMFGVLGEYLWRNFEETKRRPPFIISEKIGLDEGN